MIELYDGFTQARYEALFAPLAKDHGACATPLEIRADSAVSAHVAIGCERGHLEYALTVDQAGAIIAASVTSHAEAAPAPPSQCVAKRSM